MTPPTSVRFIAAAFACFFSFALHAQTPAVRVPEAGMPALRAAGEARGLLIGANVDRPASEYEPRFAEVLVQEFNLLSTSAPTWMISHPEAARWDFTLMDAAVEFATANGMRVLGNNILWGARGVDDKGKELWNNYPPSYIHDKLSPDQLKKILKDHIAALITRYKGKVREWVVVNEPLGDVAGKNGGFRQDIFTRKLGAANYVTEAFKAAHEADPEAILILNESGAAEVNEKATRLYAFVKDLLKRGAPVHAVGLQMHVNQSGIKPVDFASVAKNLERFAALGVKVKFTETDVAVGGMEQGLRGYAQSQTYRAIVETCLRVPACDEITFWGFTDKHNWYADELGDTDQEPLLFDVVYRKKPAYLAVLGALTSPPPKPMPPPSPIASKKRSK